MTAFEAALITAALAGASGFFLALAMTYSKIAGLKRMAELRWEQRCEYKQWYQEREGHTEALLLIADATRNGKSGTAQRIYRMAMEGLGDGNG